MKPEHYFLGSNATRQVILQRISSLEIGETHYRITIADSMSKTVRQRGLQWLWYGDVVDSGFGSFVNKDDLHIASKWKFARPILMRDDPMFAFVFPGLTEAHKADKKKMKWIADKFISTEGKDFAINEYLSEFERYWRPKGVHLTIPEKALLE